MTIIHGFWQFWFHQVVEMSSSWVTQRPVKSDIKWKNSFSVNGQKSLNQAWVVLAASSSLCHFQHRIMHIFALKLVKIYLWPRYFLNPTTVRCVQKQSLASESIKPSTFSILQKTFSVQPCKISMQTKQKKVSLNWTVDLLLKLNSHLITPETQS